MSKKEIKKPQDPREPGIENVGINKNMLAKIKDHKKKTGMSIRFFVEQAINEHFKNIEAVEVELK